MNSTADVALETTTAVAALLGVGTGIGLLLVVLGRRGTDPNRPRTRGTGAVGRHRTPRLALTVAAAVVTGLLTGWVVGAVLAGLAAWALPRVLGRDPEHASRVARTEAVATWTEMLRDTLSAAAGLEQAILATVPLAPAVIRGEIDDLAAGIENGERLAPALRRLGERLDDPVGDLVIAALLLAAEQQTRRLADLLGSLADAARGQAAMRMRVEAGRARTRTSVRVIVGTTLVFAAAVVLLNRSYMAAYDSATGQLVLLGIGALFAVGFAWLARIAHVAQPDRFLSLDGRKAFPGDRQAGVAS
ncbi:type II secretion system F family protein [Saccharothrix obliqua]|uniref:type II secretion system F family protein n=1 Tax=Saccharothrix obliqua TaxID=2861747 RepID=UPI001C5D7590|nr:type II secretion system F family protein [Saccharothrix obliqua]MBW4717371.1 type II secretion system F family protein [Saccharothrix obliqua]